LPITPRAAVGGPPSMDCDNIADSKHPRIGRLTQVIA
jgi:hypothetical protein